MLTSLRVLAFLLVVGMLPTLIRADDYVDVVRSVSPRIVKLYGAGGLSGLEAYQTGVIISPNGHVLTTWSYVLDTDDIGVVLEDGRRLAGELVGADPIVEIAVLKCDAGEQELPHFDLFNAQPAHLGTPILAFSNLFGIAAGAERVSVLHGVVCATGPLAARRGAYDLRYQGDVYVLDAVTSNPGAAGGAVTDVDGNLLGLIGKEVRSQLTGTWLNFAIPIAVIGPIVEDIRAGRHQSRPLDDFTRPDNPQSLANLGLVLVPEVVQRTPPFVDRVVAGSRADENGLRADDLVVAVNGQFVNSCRDLIERLAALEHDVPLTITVLRDRDMIDVALIATSYLDP